MEKKTETTIVHSIWGLYRELSRDSGKEIGNYYSIYIFYMGHIRVI